MKIDRFFWTIAYKNNINPVIKKLSSLMANILIIYTKNDIRRKIPLSTEFKHGAIGVVIGKKVKLGNYIKIGQNVTIGARHHEFPIVENYVIIHANSVVIGNITIGHHSVIGAGSVVLHDIPPYSVVVGNPAHIIKSMKTDDEYWNYRV